MSSTFDESVILNRSPITTSRPLLQRILLICGIGYGVTYVVSNDLIAAAMFDGYSRLDQAISELSGTRAPSQLPRRLVPGQHAPMHRVPDRLPKHRSASNRLGSSHRRRFGAL